MAWEDRTKAEKRAARLAAKKYAETDDDLDYLVITGKGTRIIAHGINSAKVLAGKDGTYDRKDQR